MTQTTMLSSAQWFLRLGLAAGFLYAVADRFGLWGSPGAPNVAWGEWSAFVDYVATLNWFVPAPFIPVLALTMTIALGIKAPLDFSVFATVGGAFLLAANGY